MELRSVKRLLQPDKLISAVIAIALVFVCSSVAGWMIYNKYREVRSQSALIQTEVFRDGLFAIRDLARLGKELNLAAQDIELDTRTRGALQDAYDFLFVRVDTLRNRLRDTPSPEMDTAVLQLMGIIAMGDRALSEDHVNPRALRDRSSELIDRASESVMVFVDAQFVRQSRVVNGQITTLEQLAFLSLGFLMVFSLLAVACVLVVGRQYRMQLKWRAAEQHAAYLAYFDALTGLPNRIRFRKDAEALVRMNKEPLLLVSDVDDFKTINDMHGHAAGDAVLIRVAKKMSEIVERYNGVCARLGGDEFAAIIPGPMSSMRTAALCEEIIAEVSQPFEAERLLLTPSISLGVVYAPMIPNNEGRSVSDLQKAADIALYKSKSDGKNTYSFYDAGLANAVARRNFVENALREALAHDDLDLAYQPQIDMRTGETVGFEALARWTHEGEFISPGEFIPIAEETGQIIHLDQWCFRRAAQQLCQWMDEGRAPVKMSTNFSSLHFRSTDIVDFIRDELKALDLDPSLVTVEVTESMMIEDFGTTLRILELLRGLGVGLALDDFGTGYSSLAYLRKLDLDYIKIDQSFVRDLETSEETQVVMGSLVTIAKGLNKKLVVEGIETETQADILRDLNCDVGQGYLFGRPMPADDAAKMIAWMKDPLARSG